MSVRILVGDCLERLRTLPEESVHCVVTSPPYWGLRDYGVAGAIGLERTLQEHIDALVRVFREVRRVLRSDGTLWLNYGDSYTAAQGINKDGSPRLPKVPTTIQNVPTDRKPGQQDLPAGWSTRKVSRTSRVTRDNNFGLKPKDLMMMPARVTLALQADGWWLRSEIVWHKPNPMPESVRDRPTSAHEKLFLLTKAARYFYDAVAVRVACSPNTHARRKDRERVPRKGSDTYDRRAGTWKEKRTVAEQAEIGANLRNVWTIPTHAYPDARFATFPPKLVEPCIKAGTSEKGCCSACGAPWARVTERKQVNPGNRQTNGPRSMERRQESAGFEQRLETQVETLGWQPTCEHDTEPVHCKVLDPFGGSGTVGLVASRFGRDAILIELNPEYAEMAERRIYSDAPILADVGVSA